MTAAELMTEAVLLLGYADPSGRIAADTQMQQRAMTAINAAYADLFYSLGGEDFKPVKAPEDVIDLPERVLNDVILYGVAAFLAQSENDGDQQQYYVMLYNAKRAALTRTETVSDVLPCPE